MFSHDSPEALIQEIQIGLAAGVDADAQADTNRKVQDAIKRYVDQLLTRDLKALPPMELVKSLTFLAKSWDEQVRLTQFVSGKPDSRPEIHGSDWLKCLTNEQFQQVKEWVAQADVEGPNETQD